MKTEFEIMRGLFYDFYEINERILTGDICSNKTAMVRAKKLAEKAKKELIKADCTDVMIDPYMAAGGWVGITYSYYHITTGPVTCSLIPRRNAS